MVAINPNLVPSITPGSIFNTFIEDTTLNIRWLTPNDPVFYEALNRPTGDIVLRQLIIAKAIDNLQLRMSHLSIFPFLTSPKITIGSVDYELPLAWIWDMHVSLPSKWENLRLSKIKRISGINNSGSSSDDITGTLRFIFSANETGSAIEVSLFYADYQINSFFTYQPQRIRIVTSSEETIPIDPSEAGTVDGFLTFRTLTLTDQTNEDFLKLLAPPTGGTDSNGDGIYDSPAIYEMANSEPGGITQPDDFMSGSLSHGTGILVNSASNPIPNQDSDIKSWLTAMNYPFRAGATRTSTNGITIPSAIFNEFSLVVPTWDQASDDTTLNNSPIWISYIERLDDLAHRVKIVFATHTIKSGTPEIVEFAELILDRDYASGDARNITPIENLLQENGNNSFQQGFGYGHVILSSKWSDTTSEIDNFFDSFLAILDNPPRAAYVKSSSILSCYALDRNSRNVPTNGQRNALAGSSARRATPLHPDDDNRFVTEDDEGLGDAVDFRTLAGFPDSLRENEDLACIGYKATSIHKIVKLVVDSSKANHEYDRDIKPRLQILFGRDPIFGDGWYDGTIIKFYNGDSWQEM